MEIIPVNNKITIASIVKKAIKEKSILYLNGFMDPFYFLMPALIGVLNSYKKVILTPRGMLYESAIAVKSIKKKLFIQLVKMLGVQNKFRWHVTNREEEMQVRNVFDTANDFFICSNLPNLYDTQRPFLKKENELILSSVSLISPVKNIRLVLQSLTTIKNYNISYHIYGIIKDAAYWEACLDEMKKMPANISCVYHGEIKSEEVPGRLAHTHFFILPSEGENFGHAIVEALSVGRPVITSFNTPWNELEESKAGFNIEIDSPEGVANAIKVAAEMENDEYETWCTGAKEYLAARLQLPEIKKQYKALFWQTV
jgi:glycosyltransferase involved in cell wall biosynthesis